VREESRKKTKRVGNDYGKRNGRGRKYDRKRIER
jgi:hypothetical protein